MKRRVERHSVLQDAVADVQQFSHEGPDDNRLRLVPLGEPLPEASIAALQRRAVIAGK